MDEILARLERIERRLDALEGRAAPPVVTRLDESFVSPPLLREKPFEDGYAPRTLPGRSASLPGDLPLQEKAHEEGETNLEALLGARWLPRAGAVAVIAALAYLVGLGLQRGIVTPESVAVGIALVCAAVAFLGARMRGAREAFGNVLVGLGAGGLYVDAVGANLYHELLSGEAMVAACVAVSLATLGFGARRALPSFLGIGLFGGLLAAMMPLAKDNTSAAEALLLLVSAPAFLVAALRRWPLTVAVSWGAAFLAALAILFSKGDLAFRLGTLDALLLWALAAWAWAAEPMPKDDPHGAFPFVAALATGAAALGAEGGVRGAGHLVLLGGLVGMVGLFLAARASGRLVRLAGTVLVVVMAPLGLPTLVGATTYAGGALLGVGIALVGLRAVEYREIARTVGILVAIQTTLALILYGYAALASMPIPYEAGLVALLGFATVGVAATLNTLETRVVAGIVVWGLATRLAVLATDWPQNAAVTAAWLVVFAGLLAVGFVRKRAELRQLGLVVAVATAGKVVLVDLAGLDAALKAVVLMVLGLVLLGGGYAYVRWAARTDA